MPLLEPARRAAALLLALSLAALAGCGPRGSPGSSSDANAALPFPVPSGWSVLPPGKPAGDNAPQTLRLRDATGACEMQFSRTFTALSLHDWQADLTASFAKAGVAAEPQQAMSLGGAPAAHLFLRFPTGVIEQVYALRSGDDLLTLVTVHARLCKDDFQSTLDAFRI